MFGISPAFASEGGGEHMTAEEHEAEEYGPQYTQIVYGCINFAIFAVLFWVIARKPIGAAIAGRAASIRSGLDEAARLQAEAQARFDSVEVRLAALDKEIEEMRADALEDAEREAATLRARGAVEAVRIKESAERAIREESARAKAEIRQEAVALAVQLAKETLTRTITREDQERLAREFLAAVDADRPSNPKGA